MMEPNAACRSNRRRVELNSVRLSPWLLSLLLALAGCAKLDLGESLPLWKSEPKPQTPDSLSAVWAETTLHQPGKPVVRGFGGRILFHGGEEQQAVPVEGNVIVYAYDNDRPNPEDPAPDKKYVFPAENLAQHQSESSLGPSYSFWLPWDNAGGPQRRISLLTRFEDKSGKVVMSQMAHATLPGPAAPPQSNSGLAQFPRQLPNATALPGAAPESFGMTRPPDWTPPGNVLGAPSGIQQASYEAPATTEPGLRAAAQNSHPPRSMTIEVAPGQASRLLAASRSAVDPQQRQSSPPQTAPGAGGVSREPSAQVASQRVAAGSAEQQAAPLTGSAPRQSQVRNPPATRPAYDPVRRAPHHVESPRRLPPTPRSGWSQPEAAPLADDASADR